MPTRPKTHAQRQREEHPELFARLRDSADQFYGTTRWRKLRAVFRAANPLCAECAKAGRTVAGLEVHHLKPRRQFPELAYDLNNLEHLCKPCHSRKIRQEQRLGCD